MKFNLLIFLIGKSFGYFDIRYEVRLASWNTGRNRFFKNRLIWRNLQKTFFANICIKLSPRRAPFW